jgi:hypothetical protein
MIRGGELGEETKTVAVINHWPCGVCSAKAKPDPGEGMNIFNVHMIV